MARDCVDRAGTKTPGEGACAACAKKHQTCLEIPRFYYVAYATWTRATDAEAVDAAKGLKTMLKAAKALTEVKPGSLLLAGIATDLALSVHLVMSGVRFLSVGSFVAVLRLGSGVFWLGFCSTSTEADASLGSGQSRGDGERVPGNENLLSVLDLQIALAREMEPQTTLAWSSLVRPSPAPVAPSFLISRHGHQLADDLQPMHQLPLRPDGIAR